MNKHILSFSVILFCALGVLAQNFTITYPITTLSGEPNELLEAPATVTNTSGDTLSMLVYRKTNNITSGHDSYFCWGPTCYGPGTSLSLDTVTLLPWSQDFSFKGYLSPTLETTGTSIVEYCFFDYNTPTDSFCVTFTYVIDSAVSVNEINEKTFSLPYPNPSSQYVMFEYDIQTNSRGIVQIHNILGSIVKEVKLTDKKAAVLIPVSELQAGVYFASLIADGRKLVTRRLVVSHK